MTGITLQSWLHQAKESYNRQAPALALLFSPDGSSSILEQLAVALQVPTHSAHLTSIQHGYWLTQSPFLQQDSNDQPDSYQPLLRSSVPESRAFADLLAAYCLYARDGDPFSDDPDELGMSADMLQDCFKSVKAGAKLDVGLLNGVWLN